MQLTNVASQAPVHPLKFKAGYNYPGIAAVSFDYMRTYLISNSGCGVSDEYHLRVNGVWLPFRGYVADMEELAQQIEAQNEYADSEES